MFVWDDDKTNAAVKCWHEGKSASVIAAEIGAPSRNCVIGKIHRMGLARTPTQRAAMRGHSSYRKKMVRIDRGGAGNAKFNHVDSEQRAIRKKLAQEAREQARNLPDLEPLTRFVDLADNCCRWFPANQEGFQGLCCGRPTKLGLSFCDHHHARAWDAVKPNRIANPANPGGEVGGHIKNDVETHKNVEEFVRS